MSEQLINLQFVAEVEKYPCLYNSKLKEYSKKDFTEKAWSKVGKTVDLTGMFYSVFGVIQFTATLHALVELHCMQYGMSYLFPICLKFMIELMIQMIYFYYRLVYQVK